MHLYQFCASARRELLPWTVDITSSVEVFVFEQSDVAFARLPRGSHTDQRNRCRHPGHPPQCELHIPGIPSSVMGPYRRTAPGLRERSLDVWRHKVPNLDRTGNLRVSGQSEHIQGYILPSPPKREKEIIILRIHISILVIENNSFQLSKVRGGGGDYSGMCWWILSWRDLATCATGTQATNSAGTTCASVVNPTATTCNPDGSTKCTFTPQGSAITPPQALRRSVRVPDPCGGHSGRRGSRWQG